MYPVCLHHRTERPVSASVSLPFLPSHSDPLYFVGLGQSIPEALWLEWHWIPRALQSRLCEDRTHNGSSLPGPSHHVLLDPQNHTQCLPWWLVSIIPAPGKLRQKDCQKLKVSLSYTVRFNVRLNLKKLTIKSLHKQRGSHQER